MPSVLRYAAVASLASSVHAIALGATPSPTVAGYGVALYDIVPTPAPSLELMRKRLEKKALTNTCTEWSILGGEGIQPYCINSATCLFTSATDGYYYEGCGQTSIVYDWTTKCWNYPQSQTGSPPVSEIFCDSSAPMCGYVAFSFGPEGTAYSFGCATKAYSLTASYMAETSSSVTLAGGTNKFTVDPSTIYVTKTPTITGGSGATETDPAGPAESVGVITPPPTKKKSTPIGAIVGGAVGGIAVIVAIAILLFCLRKKKKQKKAAAAAAAAASSSHQQQMQQQQMMSGAPAVAATGAAYHQNQRISEIGGVMKAASPPPPTQQYPTQEYFSPAGEKATAAMQAQEYRPQVQSQYGSDLSNAAPTGTVSPPPVYAQPAVSHVSSPNSQYTELDPMSAVGRQSVPPVSPVGTGTGTYVSTTAPSELGGDNRMSYQTYNPPPGETPTQSPAGYQSYSPLSTEMSGSTGGINRVPVRQEQRTDMSGAPLSENYRHHELP